MMRRRKSPIWCRELDSRSLHGIAGKLQRKGMAEGLSEREEWLWAVVISELEWRNTHGSAEWPFCSCEFCFVGVDADGFVAIEDEFPF